MLVPELFEIVDHYEERHGGMDFGALYALENRVMVLKPSSGDSLEITNWRAFPFGKGDVPEPEERWQSPWMKAQEEETS